MIVPYIISIYARVLLFSMILNIYEFHQHVKYRILLRPLLSKKKMTKYLCCQYKIEARVAITHTCIADDNNIITITMRKHTFHVRVHIVEHATDAAAAPITKERKKKIYIVSSSKSFKSFYIEIESNGGIVQIFSRNL